MSPIVTVAAESIQSNSVKLEKLKRRINANLLPKQTELVASLIFLA